MTTRVQMRSFKKVEEEEEEEKELEEGRTQEEVERS